MIAAVSPKASALVFLCIIFGGTAVGATTRHRPNRPDLQKPGRWGAPMPSKGAYAFVASIGKGAQKVEHYFDLLLASMQCLQKQRPKYDMVLIYEGDWSEDISIAFAALNVTKVYRYPDYFLSRNIDISALEEKSRPAREQNHYWHKCWNKLAAWTLVKYDKVVVLDPDIIAWENPDDMFEYPDLSAVPDYGFQVSNREHLDTFNSGLMVLEPNMHTFTKMSSLLRTYTSWFVDQGFLNDYYKHEWHNLPLPYQLWPAMVAQGFGIVNVSVVKFVHHVSESACWECNLGAKTEEECRQHICYECCIRIVKCREEAHAKIKEYRQRRGLAV